MKKAIVFERVKKDKTGGAIKQKTKVKQVMTIKPKVSLDVYKKKAATKSAISSLAGRMFN